jgi:hypothetical protein
MMFIKQSIPLLACLLFDPLGVMAMDVNFGEVQVGHSATWISEVSCNHENVPVTHTITVTITGGDVGEFTGSTGFGFMTYTVLPGQCEPPATVSFHPSSPGEKRLFIAGSETTSQGNSYLWTDTFTGTGITGPSTNLLSFDPLVGVPSSLPPVAQTVTPTGTANALSLSVRMNFDASVAGQNASLFLGAHIPASATASGLHGNQAASELRTTQETATDTWLINNGSSWSALGATIPPYLTGTLNDANAMVSILNNSNIAGLCGTEFYVGYGTSADAMLANNTLGKIYTVMCNYDMTGNASGNTASFSLSANVQVATIDAGKNGSFYVGRLQNNQWSLFDGANWVPYSESTAPAYATGILSSRQIQIYSNANVQDQVGAGIYAGYGLDLNDLLTKSKYKQVQTIQ